MTEIIPNGLKDSVKDAEKSLESIYAQIKKARAVGVDTKDLELEAETQHKQIDLIKRVYGI